MLTLERLRHPSDAEIESFDLAEVDLVCAEGLPGSEAIDIPTSLAWVNHAAGWTRRWTEGKLHHFRANPAAYDDQEEVFRVVAIMHVLLGGLGVRYNQARIDDPEVFTDSRDDFIHGIIQGHGGTCASIPVLVAAVGRRLGYPIVLATTAGHLFARWDELGGARFNIEINGKGLSTHPDDYYLTFPFDIRRDDWRRETRFLHSMTPREELSHEWSKRGHCLLANGRLAQAVDCFAVAASLFDQDRLLDRVLWHCIQELRRDVIARRPLEMPDVHFHGPPTRRYPGLTLELEREILGLTIYEDILSAPIPTVNRIDCVLTA